MESFEAMFNENVEVDVEVNEKNISSNNVEEDKLNDEPERPNKKARDLSFTMWIFLLLELLRCMWIIIIVVVVVVEW